MNFDSIDLRLLVNIAETKSLTRGAERCYISAPSASVRIKAMEDSIHTKLLYRSTHGCTLTPAGEVFLLHGQRLLRQMEVLEGNLLQYAHGNRGCIRFFANTTSITEYVPAVLRQFLATHPDINVDLREHTSVDIVRAVLEDHADIGTFAGDVDTKGLEVMPYRRDHDVLCVARQHPLASHDQIAFEEALEFDFVALNEGSAPHTFLNRVALAAHRNPKIRIKVRSFEDLCRMVEMNVGVGMLPRSAARRYSKMMDLKVLELNNDWAVRDIRICVRHMHALSPFSRELVDILLKNSEM